MNKRILFLVILLVSLRLSAAEIPKADWHVIPLPQSVFMKDEKPFTLNPKTTLRIDRRCQGNADMTRNLAFLHSYVLETTGLDLRTTIKEKKNQITLGLSNCIQNPEGYEIDASKNKINIYGATSAGVFIALQTLHKALPLVEGTKNIELPAVKIIDAPRFAFRGFMIDCCRHFFPVSYIKEIIDMLALHNINNFHWHLSDDQGWRIQIDQYPNLVTVGSKRKGTMKDWESKVCDSIPVEGYYTKEEAKAIVQYAADRHINVIPEIDMPGHTTAALASYPWLGCTGGPYEVEWQPGVFEDVICVGNPKTLQFAKDVLAEIMEIFPSPYIHIGGDECPKTRWVQCPKCQEKISELGLTNLDGYSKENRLQAWFMDELGKFIHEHGRKMVGWDEMLQGKPDGSATIMAWTSYDASVRSAQEGHPTIVCPISNYYFSNPNYNKLTGIKSISRVYNLEPVSPKLNESDACNIIGTQGCIWTEWTKDSLKMEWQILPRIAALAESQWTLPQNKDLNGFMHRLPKLVKYYEKKGWNYKKDILK